MEKVTCTTDASLLLEKLKEQYGELVFMHSEGCCDGTFPMCTQKDDFYLGSRDKLIGSVCDVPYYMNQSNLSYWEHTQIIIDVTDSNGGDSFSLESKYDKSFVIRSKKLV